MKKSLFVLFLGCALANSPQIVFAQPPDPTFTFEYDTLYTSAVGEFSITNGVSVNCQAQKVFLSWKILSTNFPQDWFGTFGICDNNACYDYFGNWNYQSYNTVEYVCANNSYAQDGFRFGGEFNSTISTGTYYLTLEATDVNSSSNVQKHTYVVTHLLQGNKPALGIGEESGGIITYPNPAFKELNIAFDAPTDVKAVEVYNSIGQKVYSSSIRSNRATLRIRELPASSYFIQFKDRNGKTIKTKKFEKI